MIFRFHTQTCARGEGLLLHLSLSGQRVTNLPSPAWRENRAAPETRRAWEFCKLECDGLHEGATAARHISSPVGCAASRVACSRLTEGRA